MRRRPEQPALERVLADGPGVFDPPRGRSYRR
nr:MAG TPA: hypothetical protein [Caudoviricetes sp.]DAS74938.1 MAG TPA: hypothetical protein [Caudoviricetes sp.]